MAVAQSRGRSKRRGKAKTKSGLAMEPYFPVAALIPDFPGTIGNATHRQGGTTATKTLSGHQGRGVGSSQLRDGQRTDGPGPGPPGGR